MAAMIELINTNGAAWATTKAVVDSAGYDSIIVAHTGLAGAETIVIYVETLGTWEALADDSGTAKTLTASIKQLELAGGPTYGFTMADPAGTVKCGWIGKTAKTG